MMAGDFMLRFKKKLRIAILLVLVGILITAYLKVFPEYLYENKYVVGNFSVYSNQHIDTSIVRIIDSVHMLTENVFAPKNDYTFDVFLTNSYRLFWFHTFLHRKPTGASEFVTNNIYVANSEVKKNYCYNFKQDKTLKGRSLHSVIAHESVHIIIRNRIGRMKYLQILKNSNWKIEGYCEWVALHNTSIDRQNLQEIISSQSYLHNPYDRYKLYRAMVDYLLHCEKLTFIELMEFDSSFEHVLHKFASSLFFKGQQ